MPKCELWLAMDGWPKSLYLFNNKPKFNGVAGQWLVEDGDYDYCKVNQVSVNDKRNLLYDSFIKIVKGKFPSAALVKVTLELDKEPELVEL